ncbi:hypothetical protein QBC45DRAFT_97506 [Copromyces sp. CBS 386.78]|nr:hypothetical protein QBC45DRAFT_97506 [Copromyces sp. CBS 386.78]
MVPTGIISAISRFGSLTAFLLLLFSAALAQQSQGNDAVAQYPTTIEFDVVFPRNDTYAPAAVFPIIFALQNPKDATAFRPLLSWYLGKMGLRDYDGWLEEDHTDVTRPRGASEPAGSLGWHGLAYKWHAAMTNITGDPYYLIYWTDKLNGAKAEGQYSLYWVFDTLNCTSPRDWSSRNITRTNTLFTIKEGAKAPDLVAEPGVCPTLSVALCAPEELQMEHPSTFGTGDLSRCVRLTDEQPPSNPCRANMNDATASNISAILAADAFAVACRQGTNTTVCPTESLGYRLFPGFWPAIVR